jgi:hypothetical protein
MPFPSCRPFELLRIDQTPALHIRRNLNENFIGKAEINELLWVEG